MPMLTIITRGGSDPITLRCRLDFTGGIAKMEFPVPNGPEEAGYAPLKASL